ncbi:MULTISPECIES: cell envelope integrity protein CreD [Vibrio]|uniref:cell envelope integrity protein CreD n=1 Tax=Vibrio TaxID=662 RepID=UPI002075368B|nr:MULTISPECIES: cell envelope integrity protein CreD [Vibrio]USD35191.1 cell envelope integrity protein CreD [Vibrio sp. SCSIO 43186]USD48257.1 cell envelope integrity protein CreD [Vibrio sp. SCSIO 43145]USD72316.1 cell envelope integrity protein CreD [Vibrio sp. SCSIO 43139]USD97993.1 cell envelope integrity protein CreD [Vibrio coralliilyticus]
MKKIFNNQLGMKFGFVLLLFVLLQIPVSMVSGLVSERAYRQQEVREEIARSSSGEQRIIGPFIAVDFTETVSSEERTYTVERQAYILPDIFDMTAHLDSFEKYRGIYKARLYKAQSALKGSFDLSLLNKLKQHQIKKVTMVVGIKDSRGLVKLDAMKLGSKTFNVVPGTGIKQLAQGFHTSLDLVHLDPNQSLDFNLSFLLQGMGKLQVTPIGNTTSVTLSSKWPHPSFIGDYLPVASDVSESGFSAKWASSNFSSNITQLFKNCMEEASSCDELEQRQMGVDLIDPVDHYLKSHRAINYSLLVITLVFASFFLLELFQARPVHPVQYGFVGLALALFYLLLISLSEHTGFNWAYVISVLASTSLLSVYVSGMLDNTRQGAVFGASLLCLYGLLFGLLEAESYALLMGTVLCFVILAFVMVITRKVDWYQRSKKVVQPPKARGEAQNE